MIKSFSEDLDTNIKSPPINWLFNMNNDVKLLNIEKE